MLHIVTSWLCKIIAYNSRIKPDYMVDTTTNSPAAEPSYLKYLMIAVVEEGEGMLRNLFGTVPTYMSDVISERSKTMNESAFSISDDFKLSELSIQIFACHQFLSVPCGLRTLVTSVSGRPADSHFETFLRRTYTTFQILKLHGL